jgi:serine/threonine protein kinase
MKEYVVDVIGKTDDNLAVILQPVCEDISRRDLLYTGDQLIQIINVVCEINIICKLSLRDLRPSNILVQNNGNICIIDFCSVVAMDQVVPYYGTSKFASSRILEYLSSNVITFPIQFGDDYHSLVRLCYVSMISGAYPQLKRLESHNYQIETCQRSLAQS